MLCGHDLGFLTTAFLVPGTGPGLYTHRQRSERARQVCGAASGLIRRVFYVTKETWKELRLHKGCKAVAFKPFLP